MTLDQQGLMNDEDIPSSHDGFGAALLDALGIPDNCHSAMGSEPSANGGFRASCRGCGDCRACTHRTPLYRRACPANQGGHAEAEWGHDFIIVIDNGNG